MYSNNDITDTSTDFGYGFYIPEFYDIKIEEIELPVRHEYHLPIYQNPFIEQRIKPPTV